MQYRRKQRLFLILFIITILSIIMYLFNTALKNNINFFYKPGEVIMGRGDELLRPSIGETIRIGGYVKTGSVQYQAQSKLINFILTDESMQEINVSYQGILPDLFREGQGIITDGVLVSKNSFSATQVLAKHDENYNPPQLNNEI